MPIEALPQQQSWVSASIGILSPCCHCHWDRLFGLLFSRRDTQWIFQAIRQGKQNNLSCLKLSLSVILIDSVIPNFYKVSILVAVTVSGDYRTFFDRKKTLQHQLLSWASLYCYHKFLVNMAQICRCTSQIVVQIIVVLVAITVVPQHSAQ